MKLTQQQLEFIMFLSKIESENSHQMYKQIAENFGITIQGVGKRLEYLRRKGILNPKISINQEAFKTLINDQI